MRSAQIIQEIDQLDLSEKLALVADVWDSIAADNLEIPMQEWQKEELDKRYQEYKKGKTELHSWEKVHRDLREKYQ